MKPQKKIILSDFTKLFAKYRLSGKSLTVYLKENKKLTGKIIWIDSYAIKLALDNERESVTIPMHNVLCYQCEHFTREDEVEKSEFYRVGVMETGEEKSQVKEYWYKKVPLHFYLRNGIEIKGRLKKFQDYVYSIKPDNEDQECHITKRHILYYKKIKT